MSELLVNIATFKRDENDCDEFERSNSICSCCICQINFDRLEVYNLHMLTHCKCSVPREKQGTNCIDSDDDDDEDVDFESNSKENVESTKLHSM